MEFFNFDAIYVERLRSKDPVTERHFFDYFSELLLIKLRFRLSSPQAREDVRQETFVRVLKALRTPQGIREPEKLGAFVNSVCNNVLLEHYRTSSRGETLDEESSELPDEAMDLDGFLVTRQRQERVKEVLMQLPAKDRDLLRAVFLEERDRGQVCRDFGVDREYLRVLLHRAKASFKVFYEKDMRRTVKTQGSRVRV